MASGVERIVLTGVTQGLGFEMTNWFQAHGHIVLGCGRNQEKIEQMNTRFCTSDRNKKQFSVVDWTENVRVKKRAVDVSRKFGPPTLVINNAGLTNHRANLWEVPAEEFEIGRAHV